jgi:hypothetical protein
MASLADAHRIALKFPGAAVAEDGMTCTVMVKGKPKGFAWCWRERIHPKKARVPNPSALAVRVGSLSEKEIILGSDTTKFFTEPHYDGYAAVLIWLKEIGEEELEDLMYESWRLTAPKNLVN